MSAALRRPSLTILYDKLNFSEDENPFTWLEQTAQEFSPDDHSTSSTSSPWTTSSGVSSVATSIASLPLCCSDGESDSEVESSESEQETMYDPSQDQYQVIDGIAYHQSLLEGTSFNVSSVLPAPETSYNYTTLSPVYEVVHLPQLPPASPVERTTPLAPMTLPSTNRILRSSQPKSTRRTSIPLHPANISDVEESRESEGNDSDGEYSQSPYFGNRRRLAFSKHTRSTRSNRQISDSHYTPPSTPPTSTRGPRRLRNPPTSRNIQISSPSFPSYLKDTPEDFICPECGWEQTNRRLPDFKRHLRTHTRPSDADQQQGWWCKGIPIEEAKGRAAGMEMYQFAGHWRVGGCLRTFSRRDALKRHLDNPNVSCIGRPTFATEL